MSQERGNAPAEFVLVSALLVALVLGVMQVVMVGYVRHVLSSAAAEGARIGSVVDAGEFAAQQHTQNLIEMSLSRAYSQQVSASRSTRLGVPTLQVSVVAPYPAVGLWTVGGFLEVSAHAVLEYAR